MPQIVIPDTWRVVARQTIGAEIAINVWHVQSSDGITAPNLPAVRAAIRDFYVNDATDTPRGINFNHHDKWRLEEVTTQDLRSVPYDDPVSLSVGVAGIENVVPALPDQVAHCVTLRTGVSSRRARGRIFLAGYHENDVTEDASGNARPSTGAVTQVTNGLTDLAAGLEAANAVLAVVSEVDGIGRPVTAARVPNKFSTQRRRQAQIDATSVSTVDMTF